jgi:hypothetical protein
MRPGFQQLHGVNCKIEGGKGGADMMRANRGRGA